MFDTAKVQRMLPELEQFVRTHSEIYLLVQGGNIQNLFALMKRLQIVPRALIINSPTPIPPQSIAGIPLMRMDDAVRNFNARTSIVILDKKSPPNPLTNIAIGIVGGQQLNIPAFVMNGDECMALYDRITLMRVLQQYVEDGIGNIPPNILMQKFARGLTTFLDPDCQNIKVQFFDTRTRVEPKFDIDDVGVVMQGPLVYENNYTLQTARWYRRLYPNIPIVISTWKGEATEQFRADCKKHSIVLLENELPSEPGFAHINFQLESSFQGVKFIKENTNVKFVLRSRVDQRFYRQDFLVYLKNMLKAFPPFGNKLKGRIAALGSRYTRIWLPFGVSDFFYFGTIEDIYKLFSIRRQTSADRKHADRHGSWRNKFQSLPARYECPMPRPNPRQFVSDKKVSQFHRIMARLISPEPYIMKTFYSEQIAPFDPNDALEVYWKFIRDYLTIVDGNLISLHWPKYEEKMRYEIDNYYYHYPWPEGGALDQPNWLDFYANEI